MALTPAAHRLVSPFLPDFTYILEKRQPARPDAYRGSDTIRLVRLVLDHVRSPGFFSSLADSDWSAVLVRLDDLVCLRRVNGNFSIIATALTSIQLPNLERVTGNLYVSGPAQAAALQLPALREVGGNLTIGGGTPLRNLLAIDLRALERVGDDLRLEDTMSLSSLDLPTLDEVGRHLWIRRNAALNTFTVAGVHALGGALRVEGNPALRRLGLPSLVDIGLDDTSELAIEDNAVLADLQGLAAVRSLSGSLVVRRNPALATATAHALAGQLTTLGGIVVISDNGP